ncbi:hypothetical protein DF185_03640 [Marinifilum breve]|uniref:Uncharacterized protein n=1 Tax=Marinifilum breve TaxID=2184082 RepID=A0A2V4A5J9_9BACT|nr:hypothetical protein [Marinifilum breve]PXY03187.1 hypothetical protein DF185_03640 [Marinifilum breve]
MESSETQHMQEIYSPVRSYESIYKQLHHENTNSLFKDLVKKSQIDIEANRATNKQIDENNGRTAGNNKSIRNQKGLKTFAIVLLVIAVAAIIYSAVQLQSTYQTASYIGIIVIAIAFIVLSIFLIKKTKEKLSKLHSIEDKLLEKSKKLHGEAEEQMRPLNNLLYENYNTELFTKTIPLVEFDKIFDSKRLDYMKSKFGLDTSDHEQNMEQSTLYVQSGEIKGNPFFIRENIKHTMGSKRYEGSLTIHWTTTEKDSSGNRRTVNHSQTLHADVVKPCPFYSTTSHLVYGNEIGDRLSFSRQPAYIHELKERKIEKEVKKKSKELQKLTEKSTKNGGTFTALANNEFDALFYAKDRNNESQFRLLFTPLAQQELIKIIKDKEVGFGDDFTFLKRNMINYIYPEHLDKLNLQVQKDYFIGIDYDKVEKNFNDYHNKYFKHVFFSFAPLFAVPLYTQHQTQEYIYKDLYDSYISFYEHEMVANGLNINDLKPTDSNTHNIVKTSLAKSQENVDTLNVLAWGYKTNERLEYVSKFGNDGRWHKVPVYWTEYSSVEKKSTIEVKILNKGETNAEKQANDNWSDFGNIIARVAK